MNRDRHAFAPDDRDEDMALVIAAAESDDNAGFCAECSAEHCTEPDARQYECDDCGAFAVYGWMVWLGAA